MFLSHEKMSLTIKTIFCLTFFFILSVAKPDDIPIEVLKTRLNVASKLQDDVPNTTESTTNNNNETQISLVTHHKDFFQRHFDATEYEPRMEVIALGLNYNNESATLSASIFVGVPNIAENLNSKTSNNFSSKLILTSSSSDTTEKFSSYEIYLTAISDDGLKEPPSSCLSDAFLQHSSREVFVGCPLPNVRGDFKSDVQHARISGEASCIQSDANNFTVVFRHVYSAYYCILIQPQVGTHTRRTFSRMAHYQTSKHPSDITEWQTTIDLQPIPRSQSIAAAFTLPDSSYQIISRQLRVDLLQVSGDVCNDPDQIKVIGTKMVFVEMGVKAADIEFVGQSPGLYCIVVIPVDERCEGNNFWKTKGRSCARHSAKSVRLQAPPTALGKNGGSKTVAIIRTPTLEIWATFTIICAFCIGLALISLLGTIVVYRRRHKKRLQRLQQRRQHQLLLEWGPTAEISSTDSNINLKSFPSVNGSNHVSMVSAPMLKVKNNVSTPISVLLLYRRDDAQTSQYSSNLRKQLLTDCAGQIKVYDYGDETQWEEMATEGLDWLPNRICGNGGTTSSHMTRIIVIHSPVEAMCSLAKYEQQKEENSDEDKNTSPLLVHSAQDSVENNKGILKVEAESLTESVSPHSTADHEFLYGMQLLKSFMRDSIECCASTEQIHASSLYRRVFNVRYTGILDCTLSSEKENQNSRLVYPHLDVAPFTCYILPGHYSQLLQHLTSP